MTQKLIILALAVAAFGLPVLLANLGPNDVFTPFFEGMK